jgi:hypothetical protein
VRSVMDRRGAETSVSKGGRPRTNGCLDRRAALTRRFLSRNPEAGKTLRAIWRGGRKDLGARDGPRAAASRGIGPGRRERAPRYAW